MIEHFSRALSDPAANNSTLPWSGHGFDQVGQASRLITAGGPRPAAFAAWSSGKSGDVSTSVGYYTATDVNWTVALNCPNVSCSSSLPLYCVQQ